MNQETYFLREYHKADQIYRNGLRHHLLWVVVLVVILGIHAGMWIFYPADRNVCGAIIPAFFIAFLGLNFWSAYRTEKRLVEEGFPIQGKISSTYSRPSKSNFYIVYQFTSPTGQLITGTKDKLFAPKIKPEPNTPVIVWYVDEQTHTIL